MTAEAHRFDDLHRLVNRLNPAQADAVRAVVLQLVTDEPASSQESSDEWPPPWFGSITAGEPGYRRANQGDLAG